MNTTRTIIHSDGHTDVETYMKDADGVWIWAVTQCNQEKQAMTGYNGLNSVKTNLAKAGICKHDGLRFTDPKCTHATAAQIAYTKKLDADYDFMQEHKDQARLCNSIVQDVQPRLNFFLDMCSDIDAQNGELGADELDINRWMIEADGCGNDSDLHDLAIGR